MSETNVLKGIPASQGIAIGKVFLITTKEFPLMPQKIPATKIKQEITAYKNALIRTRQEMLYGKEQILKILGKEHSLLADAYLLLLDDPLLTRDVVRKITEDAVNAEYALADVLNRVIQSFEKIDSAYFRDRKDDIIEVGKRILHHLVGTERKKISDVNKGDIVICHGLSPSDVVTIKERGVEGFAIDSGGKTSHVAILAQGLEIPAVVGLKNISSLVKDGQIVIIDGTQGLVIISPDEQTLENYRREYEISVREAQELEKLRNLPAQTIDDYRINIVCNIDLLEETKAVLKYGGEGIGLLRTEFLYLNQNELPTEEKHYQVYRDIAQKILPYSVVIRTLDLGGDKLSQLGIEGLMQEDNPFLGLRAIRLCLKYKDIFRTQLRGILRASKYGKIKIMYPMICGIDEYREANKFLEKIKQELLQEGVEFDQNILVGAMIETPSAALTADMIAKEADFISIGTNDLIQYTLAVDRMNENVAFMYEPLHLSVLRLLKHIIDAAKQAGKWISLCGDMAADPTFTKILVGMGLNEFSVPPVAVPKIKKIIRSISMEEAKGIVQEIFFSSDREEAITKIKQISTIV